jgi:NADH:ubiquinone oxidoreductase subunit 4 (subunit M)
VVISLYYHLRVPKAAYPDHADTQTPALALSLYGKALAILMVVPIVAMGFYPTGLLKLVYAATLGIIS